jgi:integrase
MAKSRKLSLETPTARLKLKIQKKPHWLRLGPGLSLGYRRNESAGTWSIRAADGRGGERLKKFGVADDHEPADDKRIFSYSQAVNAARQLVYGDVPSPSAALTVKAVLAAYAIDLKSRGANTYNARWPLKYLPAALATKPVALIDTQEWRKWRDSLIGDLAAAAVNRVIGAVSAACNLAASHDSRLAGHRAWQVGLQGLPNANRARNMILADDEVRRLVEAAYAKNNRFGLFVETLAQTGARPSQAARIEVGDLRLDNPAAPQLNVPRSGKGGGRLRIERKVTRVGVPIPKALADRLKTAAAGRPPSAPLLIWRDDRGWGNDPSANYRAEMRAIVVEVGLDPTEVTAYAFRHSSIVRQLLADVPVRIVAAGHDTSITQIEAHYSKYITEHSDALTRKGLLQLDVPAAAANVVAIGRART